MLTSQIVPPNAIEAEESILGGIMLDPDAIGRVVDILVPNCFYVQAHQIIYNMALDLYLKNQPTDFLTINCALNDRHFMGKIGGIEKLSMLLNRTVSAVNIDRYAILVMEKYQRRLLIQKANEILELAKETSMDLSEVLSRSEEKILDVTFKKEEKHEPEMIGDCLSEVLRRLEEGRSPGISTGLIDLDKMTGGLSPSNMIVVAGRASMGKTQLGLELAHQLSLNQPHPVVFFTAEMDRYQMTNRLLAKCSGVDSSRITQVALAGDDVDRIWGAGIEGVSHAQIILDDKVSSGLTPAYMESVLRRTRNQYGGLGGIVLDYIQMLGNGGVNNRAQEIAKYSLCCKELAKKFKVPFIVLAQINREVEGQQNKRPMMSHIKDCGSIEQDADLILTLYRDEYYNPDNSSDKGIMEINVVKNRNGPTGVVKVLFQKETGTFKNLLSRMG